LLSAAALLATTNVRAQQPAAAPTISGFQAYGLRHVRADEVRTQVEQLLAGGREPFELVVDAAGNRLLVGGSPMSQALVAQALATLDRPPVAAQPALVAPQPPVAAAPTMRIEAYPAPGGNAATLAEQLQRQFAAAGIRAAADARTGQVIVAAGDDVHRAVAQYLSGSNSSAGPANVNVAPNVARTLTLQTADWPTLEERLRALYGSRLASTPDAGGRTRIRLTLSDAAPLELVFDPASRQVQLLGDAAKAEAAARLLTALDRQAAAGNPQGSAQRVVPYRAADRDSIRQAMTVSHRLTDPPATTPANEQVPNGPALPRNMPLMAQVFQPGNAQNPPAVQQPAGAAAPPVPAAAANAQPGMAAQPGVVVQPGAGAAIAPGADPAVVAAAVQAQAAQAGLVGPVQIEFLDGLDVLVVSGNDRDVERVIKIIEDIERLSVDTQPAVEIVPLQHVSGEALATVVTQIYNAVLSTRQGTVSITALVKPNALLLIGRAESVEAVKELITKLDQPVEPQSQFAVFPLKHASAATVQATLVGFFVERTGLGPKVEVTADVRTNSVIVRAGPRDLQEAGELIKRLDVTGGEAENELRVFHLENALAEELAPVLQEAVAAQAAGGSSTGGGLQALAQAGGVNGATAASSAAAQSARSAGLRFTTIDSEGHRQYRSGILNDVRITADARANSLVVSAPAEAMELIGALVRQLDATPAARSQIKVFTIVNGDASALVEMLNALFGRTTTTGAGGFGGGNQNQQQAQNLLVPLRFSVDQRTNSIIASGSTEDLTVVEAILLRLDDSDVRQRQSVVYRLKNAPATDVAQAINEFLRSEREVQQVQPGLLSPFEQIEREVVVVPEPVSNSLIVSSTPRYFEEIAKLVEDIDKRPPMVMIQVLIAEVALNNTDEFGVELGLQDSILFDRSLLGDLVTITQTTQTPQGNTVVTTTNQNVVAATNQPGYAFNNAPLGNSGATSSLANSGRVGGQGLTNFAVGRTNADLGFGGLVLSASSESVSVLIRALQESRRLDVLSRPQVMTLDNQAAFVQVGSRVPRVQGVTVNQTGQVNNVVDVNVGLILGVTPRISPDGLVVMEIDAEKSALGPELEGVPISVSVTGEVVRQPLINTTTAQTTVSAMDGQTVVLGGLITKARSTVKRRVPYLSDIPILGNLFRYDNISSERTELLIIMTPHIVRDEEDAARIRQVESARMSWCLADVRALHSSVGLYSRDDIWAEEETMTIYPDLQPTGEPIPHTVEGVPTPGASDTAPGAAPGPAIVPVPPPPPPAAQPPSPPAAIPPAGSPLLPKADKQQPGELPQAGFVEPVEEQNASDISTLEFQQQAARVPIFAPPLGNPAYGGAIYGNSPPPPPAYAPQVVPVQYAAPVMTTAAGVAP
jgi:general secretion pathway protein D